MISPQLAILRYIVRQDFTVLANFLFPGRGCANVIACMYRFGNLCRSIRGAMLASAPPEECPLKQNSKMRGYFTDSSSFKPHIKLAPHGSMIRKNIFGMCSAASNLAVKRTSVKIYLFCKWFENVPDYNSHILWQVW